MPNCVMLLVVDDTPGGTVVVVVLGTVVVVVDGAAVVLVVEGGAVVVVFGGAVVVVLGGAVVVVVAGGAVVVVVGQNRRNLGRHLVPAVALDPRLPEASRHNRSEPIKKSDRRFRTETRFRDAMLCSLFSLVVERAVGAFRTVL